MEYIIVPMDRGHIPQIAALERECFSTPWSENMLSDALFDPKASFNAPAIALYRKHGFQEAGRRKNYYQQPREDAIIMTREFEHHEAE